MSALKDSDWDYSSWGKEKPIKIDKKGVSVDTNAGLKKFYNPATITDNNGRKSLSPLMGTPFSAFTTNDRGFAEVRQMENPREHFMMGHVPKFQPSYTSMADRNSDRHTTMFGLGGFLGGYSPTTTSRKKRLPQNNSKKKKVDPYAGVPNLDNIFKTTETRKKMNEVSDAVKKNIADRKVSADARKAKRDAAKDAASNPPIPTNKADETLDITNIALSGDTHPFFMDKTEKQLKAIKRNRPNGKNDDSFPSIHAAYAFATAAYIDDMYGEKYGWKAKLPAYGIATFIGLSRIDKGEHFASDVLAGMAIGILAEKFIYKWHYGKGGVSPHKKEKESAALIIPVSNEEETSIYFVKSF